MNLSAARKIIFDMDGVITSEERYWDAAALTVWELLFSGRFLGSKPVSGLPAFKAGLSVREIAAVRRVIFCNERVISFFKQRAVNSNWDLAYLTFLYQLLSLSEYLAGREVSLTGHGRDDGDKKGLGTGELSIIRPFLPADGRDGWQPSFEAVLGGWADEEKGAGLVKKLYALFPRRYAHIFGEGENISSSLLWQGIREVFQEWYFGEHMFREIFGTEPGTPGKEGLIYREEPLIQASGIKATLDELRKQGWILGIATGRPMNELLYPLEQMDIWKYFHKESVVTFDQVAHAEKMLKGDFPFISLGKPHPYSLLKAYWGKGNNDRELACDAPPLPPGGMCWFIGDALADLLAAREAGVSFIGVLTGKNGSRNREIFTQEGAEAVLEI